MRRRVLAAVLALAAAGAVAGVLSRDAEPRADAPRVCWQNDYDGDTPRLANMCEYRSDEERWYLEVDGQVRPADEVELPVANLCLYFWGPRCPTAEEKEKGMGYPGTS